ncbi:uncharacterized protein LOC123321887 [Coccinella septempunctata]|uniref:uncharacterized protein LOC123321887 n=1 Tax=Coccinella septempunctata TaxID=41139 RepID=UPI001D08682F|nr:uncharacterized protein LOC123321887 [Coccinella septempunctata]
MDLILKRPQTTNPLDGSRRLHGLQPLFSTDTKLKMSLYSQCEEKEERRNVICEFSVEFEVTYLSLNFELLLLLNCFVENVSANKYGFIMVYHNKCSVSQCKSDSKIRHRFPNPNKELSRFKEWIHAINNVELMEMDPKKVYDSKRLCHDHFEAAYVSGWSHKLFSNAVPTLNLFCPTQSSSLDIRNTPSSSKSIE